MQPDERKDGPVAASPADTIRRAREHAGYDDMPESLREPFLALADLADALLAVGERDRRQIARLTEVGKAAQVVAELNGEKRSTYGRPVTNVEWQNALYQLETAVSGARAVLADKEDAGDG